MRGYKKRDFPVDQVRRFLEPGPVVLISSAWKGRTNIMTMGWHTVMEFSPSLIGCYIWSENHSFQMIRKSKECVINVPTIDSVNEVIGIGNTSGDTIDKFKEFELTPLSAAKVQAPLIKECYANFECRVVDFLKKYSFFILEVVKAHAPAAPKYPQTLHYRGDGVFMLSGKSINYANRFKPENL
jgi:flavin reductase (DIM6/NTAB) family NADH-FMN oxidoreductase RutF